MIFNHRYVQSGRNEMKQVKSILLYFETEPDLVALNRLVDHAKVAGAKLTVATVVEPAKSQVMLTRGDLDLDKVEELLIEDRQRQLDEAVHAIVNPGVEIETRVLVGDVDNAILKAVMTNHYDILVKQPSPSFGLRQRLFGSVDMRLLRACPCAVGIMHLKPHGYSKRAVVALDYSDDDETKAKLNRALLELTAFYIDVEIAEMHIVHAWRLYGESILAHGRGKIPPERLAAYADEEGAKRQQWLERVVNEYRNSLPSDRANVFNPKIELLRGDPKIAIPQRVKELEADFVYIGTVSRKGVSGWLIGNTAEAILDCVDCSVVTLKPEGFVPPAPAT